MPESIPAPEPAGASTAVLPAPHAAPDIEAGDEFSEDVSASSRALSLAEMLCLAVASAVGIVSLVALCLADLSHYTKATVAIFSALALALVAAAVLVFDRPKVRLDLSGLIVTAVGVGIAAVMFLPGFQYATGDRDPGVYIQHAIAITHSHSTSFPDDLVQAGLPGGTTPGAQWPGLWDKPGDPGMIFPQFYHLWPALLASAKEAGGFTGLFDTGPLVGVIAVGLLVCAARRVAGLPGAWAAAFLLPTNMLEVWQAKYPSAEIFGQMLFMGALLGVIIAIRTRWLTAAAAAGVFVSLSLLERPDALIVVLMAWVGLAALVASRRFDKRGAAFAIGMLTLLPYGFYTAYSLAEHYTLANTVPTFGKVLAGMTVLAVLAGVIASRRRLVDRVLAALARPRWRWSMGLAFVGVCGLLALLGGLRPKLFGKDYFVINHGPPMRSYDEISLIRLSWFFSLPGMFLMFAGIVFVALRPWRFDRWLVALPAVALLVVYCYHLRNSAYMMWSTRRFATTVVPGMVLLMACGAALIVFALIRLVTPLAGGRAGLVRVGALAVVAVLVGGLTLFNLSESRPLRHHNENGGSVEIVKEIAAVSGERKGVFLWARSTYCCNAPHQLFGGPLLTIGNQSSALLPADPAKAITNVNRYLSYFKPTGRPVFYVADHNATPPKINGVISKKVLELTGSLPHWEETFISRPKKTKNYNYHFAVYELTAVS